MARYKAKVPKSSGEYKRASISDEIAGIDCAISVPAESVSTFLTNSDSLSLFNKFNDLCFLILMKIDLQLLSIAPKTLWIIVSC